MTRIVQIVLVAGLLTAWTQESAPAAEPALKELMALKGHRDEVTNLAFARDGKALVSSDSKRKVMIWDLETGKSQTVQNNIGGYHWAVTPDGKILAGGDAYTFRLWDLPEGKERASSKKQLSTLRCVALTPDGKTVAAGFWQTSVCVFDVATGKESASLDGHSGTVEAIAFTPDGKALAVACDRKMKNPPQIRFWDHAAGKQLPERSVVGLDATPHRLRFSPDGKLLLIGLIGSQLEQTLKIWDLAENKEKQPTSLRVASTFDWAPDGKLIALAIGKDRGERNPAGAVRLLDPDGKVLATIRAHNDPIWALAFSPDGKLLATAGADKSIKVWEVSR